MSFLGRPLVYTPWKVTPRDRAKGLRPDHVHPRDPKSMASLKSRMTDRRDERERQERIKALRIQWEKEYHYGFFNTAREIAGELRELGYNVNRQSTISIYGENL